MKTPNLQAIIDEGFDIDSQKVFDRLVNNGKLIQINGDSGIGIDFLFVNWDMVKNENGSEYREDNGVSAVDLGDG